MWTMIGLAWGRPLSSKILDTALGAKALAAVNGKLCADYHGVRAVARQVLRHRILTNFNARAQKVTVADLIDKLLADLQPNGS